METPLQIREMKNSGMKLPGCACVEMLGGVPLLPYASLSFHVAVFRVVSFITNW